MTAGQGGIGGVQGGATGLSVATTGDAAIGSGGAATGGAAIIGSGGAANGGATTAGAASGGATTAGAATGGAATGGAATGGAATGGAATGGAATGGAATGGAATGGAATGGAATGGAATGGAATGGATHQCVGGSDTRPHLSASVATGYTTLKYLAKSGTLGSLVTDNWDPTAGLGVATGFTPTYTVASSGGTHTTIQAAVNAAIAAGGTARAYIRVNAGTYREVVCVNGTRPITIYGTSTTASQVAIVSDNTSGNGTNNPCALTSGGIAASATFAARSNALQLKNLTISNDFTESTDSAATGQEAVALLTYGDKIVLENVRLLGNKATAEFETPAATTVSRVYVKDSYIEGDMQYILGRGTVVIDNSDIHFVHTRAVVKDNQWGSVMAASTAAANPFGFLVINSDVTVASGSGFTWVLLGRSDDVDATYVEGTSPNGQIVVRDTVLGEHIKAPPWGNAIPTNRTYACEGFRLWEYNNTGDGA